MGGGISVHNETDVEIIVTLSQVGPLHWERIEPGDTKKINCGQVWFTVTARLWDNKKPTAWDVVKPVVDVGIGVGSAAVASFVLVDGAGAVTAAGTGVLAKRAEDVAKTAGAVGACVGVASTLATEGNKSPETLQRKIYEDNKSPETLQHENYEGNKSPETLQHENYETWIRVTPSERSAEWLAANHVVAVVPAKEWGVYANGKTITIRQELRKASGSTRMTLKIIGT